MISDAYLAQCCVDLYSPVPATWDTIEQPEADDGICWGLRRVGEFDVLVFRGSTTPLDWARDFLAIPHEARLHPALGDVALGFMLGMDDAFGRIEPLLRKDCGLVITGHSLGAARATLMAALFISGARPPVLRVVFGEPRSGCGRLVDLLLTVPARSYRNRSDPVPCVPTDPPFKHATPLIQLDAAPPAGDSWGWLADHHIDLYLQAVAAIPA